MAELFSRINAQSQMEAKIEVNNLSISRGWQPLFSGLSTIVKNGDILWIQGANGIGKTTLLGAIAGLLRADSGTVSWCLGSEPCEANKLIAYQPHQSYAKSTLTTFEDLSFWANIYGAQALLGPALKKADLMSKSDILTGALSAGQKKRLALAKLMISQKPVWVMDEPSAAMDKKGIQLIDHLIKTHVARGGAAIIASHSPARSLSSSTRKLTLKAAS